MRLLAAAICLLFAAPAAAEPLVHCLPRPEMLGQLARSHAEMPRAWHLVHAKLVLELLASAEGSWTVISTTPTKARMSCILGAGQGATVPAVEVGS